MISNQLKSDLVYVGVPEQLLAAMIAKLRKLPYEEVAEVLVPVDFFGAVVRLPKQTVSEPSGPDVPVPPAPPAE